MFRELALIGIFVTCVIASVPKFHETLDADYLLHYFGTRNPRDVPSYEFVHPDVGTGRWRRSLNSAGKRPDLEYNLKAFGENYHLQLEKNNELLPPGCLLEKLGANGTSHIEPCMNDKNKHCYYFGTSKQHRDSKVAVSTCNGLQGMISTRDHDLILQPVKSIHRPRLPGRDRHAFPHVVYKRPARRNKTCATEGSGLTPPTLKVTKRRHRRSADIKFIEMMVVVDTEMWRFHGSDIQRYVLTAMNVAAQRYRDSSLSQKMAVSIIRMMILEHPQDGLKVTTDSSRTLSSFCNWQEGFNPSSDEDPQHADGSVLLTRLNIHHFGNHHATGLAYVSGMCLERQRCSYNEDTGGDLGMTIAHETGHNLGMEHDGGQTSCSDNVNIMATNGGIGPSSFEWSSCSSRDLDVFMGESKSQCLNDQPAGHAQRLVDTNPGLIYDADAQCQYFMGVGSTTCDLAQLYQKYGDHCSRIVCHNPNKPGSCSAGSAPFMDGTSCGTRKWCKRGACVAYGSNGPSPTNGGWSVWDANWSVCSRSCGGGLRLKKRQCDNPKPQHGGSQCEGSNVMAEMCNPQHCSSSQYQYKLEQCQATNGMPYDGRTYSWEPYLKNARNQQCELHCLATGAGFIMVRGDAKYKDGTECEPYEKSSSYGRCIEKTCRAFGCDGKLESGRVFDQCGVCDGQGDTCKKITGSFNKGQANAFVKFLTIPSRSSGIRITNKNIYSHMAVKVNGRFIFSSTGKSPDRSGTYTKDGVSVVYQKSGPEEISITGPIPKDIEIMVWRDYDDTYEGVAPEVDYAYFVPSAGHVTSNYKWTSSYGSCTQTCGTGQMIVEVQCVRSTDGSQVGDHYCNFRNKPSSHSVVCNTQACPPRWKTGSFGSCSRSCGGGQMRREVKCIRVNRRMEEVIGDIYCQHLIKPSDEAECNPDPCPGIWTAGQWSQCSLTCGKGRKTRAVKCYKDEYSGVVIPDSKCLSSKKPTSTDQCIVKVCKMTTSCEDQVKCREYGAKVCDEYHDWAVTNCAAFCHFCGKSSVVTTSTGLTADCRDLTDCSQYGESVCTGEHSSWASTNCPQFCGQCTATGGSGSQCSDVAECSQYGSNVCTQHSEWSRENCRKHCGFCSTTSGVVTTVTGVITGTISGVSGSASGSASGSSSDTCTDQEDCTQYRSDLCTTYEQFAKQKCQKHCGLCTVATSTGGGTTECTDKAKDCTIYENVCTEYKDWANKQCRKFCGFCKASTCVDKENNCSSYDSDICTSYKTWASEHCAKHCGIC